MDNTGQIIFDSNCMEFGDFAESKSELKNFDFLCLCLNTRSMRRNWNVFCASLSDSEFC